MVLAVAFELVYLHHSGHGLRRSETEYLLTSPSTDGTYLKFCHPGLTTAAREAKPKSTLESRLLPVKAKQTIPM